METVICCQGQRLQVSPPWYCENSSFTHVCLAAKCEVEYRVQIKRNCNHLPASVDGEILNLVSQTGKISPD